MKRYLIIEKTDLDESLFDGFTPIEIPTTDFYLLPTLKEFPTGFPNYTKYTEDTVQSGIDLIKSADYSDYKTSTPLEVTTKELVQGVDYDRIDISYPTTSSEVFTYSKGGSDVLTVTTAYQTDSKRNITSVVFS